MGSITHTPVTGRLINDDDWHAEHNLDLEPADVGLGNVQEDLDGKVAIVDLAASDGSAMAGFIQGEAGATPRTVQAKAREAVSAADFTGANDTEIIAAAIAAAVSRGPYVPVYLDRTYDVTSLSNNYGIRFVGPGAVTTFTPLNDDQILSSYGDGVTGFVAGREYAFRVHDRLLSGGTLKVQLFGDSTIQNGDGIVPAAYISDVLVKNLFYRRGVTRITTSNHAIGGTDWSDVDVLAAIDVNTDLVFIKTGLNDATTGTFAEMVTNMRAELAAIRASRDASTLTVCVMTANAASDGFDGINELWVEPHRAAVLQACRDYQCVFVDVYAYLRDVRGAAAGSWINNEWADGRAIHPRHSMHLQFWSLAVDAVLNMTEASQFAPYDLNISISNAQILASALPSSDGTGRYVNAVVTSDGWPIAGMVETIKHIDGGARQTLSPFAADDTRILVRSSDTSGDTWNRWSGVSEALTLVNGWAALGGGFAGASASIDSSKCVHLEGLIAGGTVTAGTTLCTLPAGMRPPVNIIRLCGTAGGATHIRVETDGDVVLQGTGDATWTSLGDISFQAA